MIRSTESAKRRMKILSILKDADRPVTGRELSRMVNVARQIVVGDIALLRSSGAPIMSSARGYAIREQPAMDDQHKKFLCRISPLTLENLMLECDSIVDNGGTIIGVSVTTEAYGVLEVKRPMGSWRDIRLYLEILEKNGTPLLSSLSGGVHLIEVETDSPEELKDIEKSLRENGLLVEEK